MFCKGYFLTVKYGKYLIQSSLLYTSKGGLSNDERSQKRPKRSCPAYGRMLRSVSEKS